jgi:signal transduction histidine kinase
MLSMLSRLICRLPRLTLVVCLLVLTLGVAAALAWQAHQAARSHEEAAKRVQLDYVEFAGWEYQRAIRLELTARLDRWLQVIACGASKGLLPEPRALASGPGCKCDDLSARTLFHVDIQSGSLETTGDPLGSEAKSWVLGATTGVRRIPAVHRGHLLEIGRVDGMLQAIAAGYAHDSNGAPTSIIGFVADPIVFAPAFERVAHATPLLPPTLAGTKNELLNISVSSHDDVPVFSSPANPSWIRTDGALDESYGRLRYQISLKPEAAEKLVIGGLPRSRVPLLLGLLALTAGLLAVAIQQLRREHDLTQLRADFVASVSHELRTPLAQIRLFSETLLLGRIRSEAEGRRSLEIIQQESRRLTHLVENVLYFSRSERGTQPLSPVPTRLATLAGELIEAFAPLARSGRADVTLTVKSEVEVSADGCALRQILLNLLDNAVKYGPPDQTVAVTIDQRGPLAVITVDDEGPGIPAEARARIWQPYSRLASAAASAVAGAGIGLAVVRDLVSRHGGEVRVEDAPSGGARFVVELPGAAMASSSTETAAAHSGVPA